MSLIEKERLKDESLITLAETLEPEQAECMPIADGADSVAAGQWPWDFIGTK